MTREEAIKKLKWFKEYNEEDFCGGDRMQDEYGDWYYRITEQDFEAFDMAIKALEQEPTTKNDLGVDCISRAEAIKCLDCDFDITGKENMKTVVNYINSAHDKIMNLPRVKQEPQTGHWKPYLKEGLRYQCSACDSRFDTPWEYCPHCGAKMAETEEI